MRLESARPGEVTWYVADISKARNRLGYAPRVPVPEGIRRAVDWAADWAGEELRNSSAPAGPPPVPGGVGAGG
jgi:hypothetical protein